MHSSAFDTSLYPSLSKRQKDKKAHDSFEDGNKEKETDQQGKKTESKDHVFLKSCTNICLISCCYEHNQLLLSLMLSPTLHPLNNPYNIQHFIGKLPEAFINKATI